MSSSPFEEVLNTVLGVKPDEPIPARALPLIRGKELDGVLYVRAEDVANALESQAPKVNARLIAKLRRQ